jgi:protein-tyrosine-phosphatase
MAEAFARRHAEEMGLELEARSGGIRPSAAVDPGVIAAMLERAIDISGAAPKPIDFTFAAGADAIVSLCGPLDPACPAPLLPKVVDLGIDDPKGAPPEKVRTIRDDIERRVLDLLQGIEWTSDAERGEVPPGGDTSGLPDETAPHSPARPGIKRGDVKRGAGSG